MIKVDRIYLIFNMAYAICHKQLYKNRNICKRGIGKIRILLNWIAYCIAYCIAYWSLHRSFRLQVVRKSTPQFPPSSRSQVHTAVFRKNLQNLHFHQKSHIACFGKKIKKSHQHCFVAHIVNKSTSWTFLTFRCPKNVFWGLGTFWHVQKIIDLFTFFYFSMNLLWSMIKVDRIYLPVDMALALVHKHL